MGCPDTRTRLRAVSLKNPIYIREESKQLIKQAVWHDSQFLSDLSTLGNITLRFSLKLIRMGRSPPDVMDYSLVIGVDAQKAELVVGIVGEFALGPIKCADGLARLTTELHRADYIRTYTWDKRLESWVKETAFLGKCPAPAASRKRHSQSSRPYGHAGGTYKAGGPTVITPKQYKTRFREAIDGYLLLVRKNLSHAFGLSDAHL